MTRDAALELYHRNREATLAAWRRLFNPETAGIYYRLFRRNASFSINDCPSPFDFTVVVCGKPSLQITNGQISIQVH